MAKLIHFVEENSCYFLTSTTYRRKQLFRINQNAQILCNIIYNLRNKKKLSLVGFVIMPEHFHLLIIPSSEVKISWIIQEIKKGSARLINQERFSRAQGRARLPDKEVFLKDPGTLGRPRPRGDLVNNRRYSGSSPTPNNNSTRYLGSSQTPNKVWMDEYYDYVIRNEKDLMMHLSYIHGNPVKRGLVESAEEYIWSSANSKFENDLEKIMSGSGTSPTT
jgi:REP element-mobilizing transposase RayT